MKTKPIWCTFIVLAIITIFSCASQGASAAAKTGKGISAEEAELDEILQKGGAPVQKNAPVAKKASSNASLYTGNGGKGMSIAVLTPSGRGLSADENYIPALIQGILVGDFTRYSAMNVIDRQTTDALVKELENPVYAEDAQVARLGATVPAQYMLVGEVSKAGTMYMLNLRIADSKTGSPKYTYQGSATRASMDDFSAIKQASEDLLYQMGITLTDAGKQSLNKTTQQTVMAETALAQGVTAQRSGSTVAALNYYSQAAKLKTGLAEAEARLAALSKKIESGDVGENIRNDIQRREAWKKLLDEAVEFYDYHPLFDVYYDPKFTAKTDYGWGKTTVQVTYNLWVVPNERWNSVLIIMKALTATGKASEWELSKYYRLLSMSYSDTVGYGEYYMRFKAELLDAEGDFLAGTESCSVRIDMRLPSDNSRVSILNLGSRFALGSFSFTVDGIDIDKVTNNISLSFTEAGKVAGHNNNINSTMKNALPNNIRIFAANKPMAQYYRGRGWEYWDGGNSGSWAAKYTFPN